MNDENRFEFCTLEKNDCFEQKIQSYYETLFFINYCNFTVIAYINDIITNQIL
jgi:hypothetical protein